jgi:hypothetical protein
MNANSKPWYQPWSEEQFRACIDVQTMLPVQRWMYRTLCQSAFVESTRPYLPDDDSQLWKMAGCENQKQWNQYKHEVRAAFIPLEINGQKLLSRGRIVKDWDRLTERREALKEFGRKGGKAKKAKSSEEPESEPAPKRSHSEVIKESKVEYSKVKYSAKPKLSIVQAKAKPKLTDNSSEKPTQTKPSFSSDDMTLTTAETVADFIAIPDNTSLEEIVSIVSDGEYSTNLLDRYNHQDQLKRACLQAVREKATSAFVGKETCADIMGRAMEILSVTFGIDTPKPWLRVMKDLRTKKGPATSLKSREEILKHMSSQVLTDPGSALHFFENELKSFRSLLVATANTRGIPDCWRDAVQFLDEVVRQNPNAQLSGLLSVRDKIQARLAPAA